MENKEGDESDGREHGDSKSDEHQNLGPLLLGSVDDENQHICELNHSSDPGDGW